MSDRNAPKVLVVGGGPAGLLTAQALQMQGAQVIVFEQDAALDARPRDWDFGIYWAQDPIAECLPESLQREVENCQVDDHKAGPDELMPIYHGKTGELMKELPIPYNIRLKRRRLLRLLQRGVDLRYGKKLKEVFSDGKIATAVFEDGTVETGDLLIGAEGAHSLVREYLVGSSNSKLEPSPVVSTLTIAQLPVEAVQTFKEHAPSNRMMIHFHPNGYFSWVGVYDIRKDTKPGEGWWMMAQSWRPSDQHYDPKVLQGDDILRDAKDRAKEFSGYFKPWDNHKGTITLVGDSAHSMTFHRGQGLNNAINDVALLGQKAKEHGFTQLAIKAYEEEMLPRGQQAVIESNKNTEAIHDWDALLQSPLFAKGLQKT